MQMRRRLRERRRHDAIGVNDDSYREVIGTAEDFTESSEYWRDFLS